MRSSRSTKKFLALNSSGIKSNDHLLQFQSPLEIMTSQIDHLVLGAEDLSSATQALESDFGVPFNVGGEHPVMGTHNRLLRLQADIYLEVIAANPTALPQRTRWFSMDDPKTKLRLNKEIHPLCWVLQVEDIHQARKNCGYDPGEVINMSRGDLEWQITVPTDGGLAEGGHLTCADSVAKWKKSCPSAHSESRSVDTSGNYASQSLQHREYSSEIGYSAGNQYHPGQPCAVLSLEHAERLFCSEV